MTELIKLRQSKIGDETLETVNGRDLHAFLEVKSRFNDWISNRISDFDFIENQDFISLTENLVSGGMRKDYFLTLDMAKELSMVERNEKGKQARQYFIECEKQLHFIECEKQLRQPPQLNDPSFLRDTLLTYTERVIALEAQIEEQKPMIEALDRIATADGSLCITDAAKSLQIRPSHYLKVMLDAVFGHECFRNEIIWKRTGSHGSAKRWGPVHDVLLFYTASNSYTWNKVYQPYDEKYLQDYYRFEDERGRYRLVSLSGAGTSKGDSGADWRGINPTASGRHWAVPRAALEAAYPDEDLSGLSTQKRLDMLDAAGLIYWPPRGNGPQQKRYADEAPGVQVQDICTDIRPIGSQARERLGYPTQKPLALLERIIAASSNEGDVVLDPFCGCGTTVHAAQNLNRQWIGIDVAVQAMHVVRDRLHHYFPSIDYDIFGIPKSVDGAKYLAKHHPFKFEEWAVSRVGGMHSGKYRGDGGIDGTFFFLTGKNDSDKSRGIISVKGGKNINPAMVRDLRGTLEREARRTNDNNSIAVLLCAEIPTKNMFEEARAAGKIQTDFGDYPRIQILTVDDLFTGASIKVPFMYNSVTAAAAGRKRGKTQLFIHPKELSMQREMFFTIEGSSAPKNADAKDAEPNVMPDEIRRAS